MNFEEIEDKNILLEMGFSLEIINKIYFHFRPRNIETALNLLNERDGIVYHAFIVNEDNNSICEICNKPRRNHLDYIENDSEIIDEDRKDEPEEPIIINILPKPYLRR